MGCLWICTILEMSVSSLTSAKISGEPPSLFGSMHSVISCSLCSNELEEQFEANKERRRPIVEDLDSLSESVD